ncbi:MAG: glycosyltransferase family protein [Rubellimicrobium sp.]|nr:glycosyltransferase family protein [Rubellimicrobium sp.]
MRNQVTLGQTGPVAAGARISDEPPARMRDRAAALHRAGHRDEARALYARCLARNPDDAQVWTNLGALLRSEGEHDLALVAQEKAHALDPANRNILNNLANILNDLGWHERSLALRRRVIALDPGDPGHRAMEGKSLRSLLRLDEGIRVLTAALSDHPDHHETRIQLALTQLASGHYAEGFRNYAARWLTGELTPRRIGTPKWDGGPLDGRTILVLPEQGLGDAVTFARFLPALRRFNPARVMLLCEKPLLRLMSGVEGADWIGTDPHEAGAWDTWTDLMDLPTLHFAASDTVPPPTRLTIPEDSRTRARAIAAPFDGRFRVGVVWGGSVTYRGNAFRSFSHRLYHRLLDVPGVQLFSHYKGPGLAAYQADGTSAFIVDTASDDRDLADTAAMMEEMDLIITSCTATAHVAGSLGRPVWTLLHWDAFWLWQVARDETPWYPSMRLIRQDRPRYWDGVLARVHADLSALVATSRKAGR